MDEALWQAIVHCDAAFDGKYYYGVSSTGIYCRPSCKSRTPKRDHVRVFSKPAEAQAAGYRPCKRCLPDRHTHGPDAEMADHVKNLIQERYPDALHLTDVAAALCVSPYHLHRLFKRQTGETFAQYLCKVRLQHAKVRLQLTNQPVITVASAVGFRSASHFTTVFQRVCGCTPTEYRKASVSTNAEQNVQ